MEEAKLVILTDECEQMQRRKETKYKKYRNIILEYKQGKNIIKL